MIRYAFEIPGKPVAWARSRRNGNRHFTAPEQARHAAMIGLAAKAADVRPIVGPVGLDITAVFAHPASWSKARRAATVYHTSKPDADNIAKIVGDALNGIAWADDAQACGISVEKMYSTDGTEKTIIIITALTAQN